MRATFTVASIVSITAWSIFGFDGFSGGDDPVDAGEGGTTNADGPLPSPDGPASDGGGDDAPSGPFCKTVGADAGLCDDFEEPGTFTGKWPEQDNYLGKLEVKDGIGFNGTRGLAFTATPDPSASIGKDAKVILGFRTPDIATVIDAELAVKLNELPPTAYVAGPLYVQIDEIAGGGYSRFGFALDGARVVSTNPVVFPAEGGAVSSGTKPITTLTVGVWTRLRLVVDLGKSPPVLYAYADGVLKNEQTIDNLFDPARVSVRIGANFAGTTDGGTIAMDLDDARFSWK